MCDFKLPKKSCIILVTISLSMSSSLSFEHCGMLINNHVPLIINVILLTLITFPLSHKHTKAHFSHMAGVVGGDWWVQGGEPGNLVLPEEWSGSGPPERVAKVTCYVSAVTIYPIHRTLLGQTLSEPKYTWLVGGTTFPVSWMNIFQCQLIFTGTTVSFTELEVKWKSSVQLILPLQCHS